MPGDEEDALFGCELLELDKRTAGGGIMLSTSTTTHSQGLERKMEGEARRSLESDGEAAGGKRTTQSW